MKERYLVEFDNYTSVKDVKNCLTSPAHFLSGVAVTELPQIPEVPVVETGILMSPMDLITGAQYIEFKDGGALSEGSEFIGKRVNVSENKLPKCCYRDIQKTFDFTAIPVGAVIEIDNYTDVGIVVKNVDGFISLQCNKNDSHHKRWVVNTNKANIKSASILKMPRDEK